MPKNISLTLLALVCLLPACATIKKADVQVVDKSPKVSKTISEASPEKKKGLKRKVAIARFTNETRYGQSFFIDDSKDRIGKQAVDILSAKLFETEKFIMLERADLDKIYSELSLGNVRPLKNMADYLIVGSITEFGRKDVGKVGIFSRTKKQVAYAKVNIRLIDVYTGQLLYSEEGEGEAWSEAGSVFGVGARAGYDSTLNDKALEAAVNNLASNVIENLLDRPWRGFILGFESGNWIISGGRSQNIRPGDTFEVVLEGKKVKNPQTNMYITLPGTRIALLEVVTCLGNTPQNEVSLCRVVDGDLSQYIANQDFSSLYIREIKAGE